MPNWIACFWNWNSFWRTSAGNFERFLSIFLVWVDCESIRSWKEEYVRILLIRSLDGIVGVAVFVVAAFNVSWEGRLEEYLEKLKGTCISSTNLGIESKTSWIFLLRAVFKTVGKSLISTIQPAQLNCFIVFRSSYPITSRREFHVASDRPRISTLVRLICCNDGLLDSVTFYRWIDRSGKLIWLMAVLVVVFEAVTVAF